MRVGWLLDGVYNRMKDQKPNERFRNGMRLVIDSSRVGSQAIMERKYYPNAHLGNWEEAWWEEAVDIKFLSDIACRIDWSAVNPRWGEKEFSLVMGRENPKGLLGDGCHLWAREGSEP